MVGQRPRFLYLSPLPLLPSNNLLIKTEVFLSDSSRKAFSNEDSGFQPSSVNTFSKGSRSHVIVKRMHGFPNHLALSICDERRLFAKDAGSILSMNVAIWVTEHLNLSEVPCVISDKAGFDLAVVGIEE